MADITIPDFKVHAQIAQRIPTKLEVLDTTNYFTENRADYYLLFVVTSLEDDSSLTTLVDFTDPKLVTKINVDIPSDGVYQTFLIFAILYGQEANTGNFVKGEITYYSSNWYLAKENITGSTDPSLSTGVDANFVLINNSNFPTYIGTSVYHYVTGWLVKEVTSLCTHNKRKTLLLTYESGDCLRPPEQLDVLIYDTFIQASDTEMSVMEMSEANKNIRTLDDMCNGD